MTDFIAFPSIPRLSGNHMVITEKIDGTNAQIYIGEDGEFLVGSRSRWITPQDDNYGFARWAMEHEADLRGLGPGSHFGEWWGSGVQRGYGLVKGEKRFSLFNVRRWALAENPPLPACCSLVPKLYEGPFETSAIEATLEALKMGGSVASPGFMQPEGIVIYHSKARILFKKTLDGDGHKHEHDRKIANGGVEQR